MNNRWISTIVLLVTFLSATGVSYGVDEQPCQPDVVVMLGNVNTICVLLEYLLPY